LLKKRVWGFITSRNLKPRQHLPFSVTQRTLGLAEKPLEQSTQECALVNNLDIYFVKGIICFAYVIFNTTKKL
jgi:hypothetical protein